MNDSETIRLELPASYKYLQVLGLCLQGMLERVDDLADREITIYNIQLAVQEICTNIVGHAYADQPGGRIVASIALASEPRHLIVELCDTGCSFDPSETSDPDLDAAQIHGYGLFLARTLMDNVSYEALPQFNRWRLIKHL